MSADAEAVIVVTFFPDSGAATKREEALHLPDLANRIATTTAPTKATLPWVKLATFGDRRTDANSLRSNTNLRKITGIEADYDGERVSFDEACETLREAGVAAIAYTSPSHTEAAPRWRVLCPLSTAHPPDERDRLMARLNGLYGDIFDPASWTLSQSYYFGSVNRNPSHRVEVIDGTPIDLMDELDAGAIGKPGAKAGNGKPPPTVAPPESTAPTGTEKRNADGTWSPVGANDIQQPGGTYRMNMASQTEAARPIDIAGAIGEPRPKASNGAERPISAGRTLSPASDARLEAWRRSVLDNLRRQAVDGQKHTELRNAALALGGIQAAAGFTDAEAVQWLMDALPASVEDWNRAKKTAAWGLEQGRARPIELEDRPYAAGNGSHDHDAEPTPNGEDAAPEPTAEEEGTASEQPHDSTGHGQASALPPGPGWLEVASQAAAPPGTWPIYAGSTDKWYVRESQEQSLWNGAHAPPDPPPADDANSAGEQPHDDPSPRGWAQSLDFFADTEVATPELRAEHLPAALWPFVQDTSARMGVDPTSMALAALVSCASVISDEWRIQPKRYDTTWTENPRLWAAIVGDPSILKTPVIAACTKPIDRLDAKARERHQEEMREYKAELATWKASEDKDSTPEPRHPKLARYIVEGSTIEALSEVLRDDDEARQHAPAKKVLSRHDEMAEFIANLDRYRTGGRGGGDRGAYLRLYNGGRHTIDRIGRGSFAIPNWSASLLGGIQPGPIQRIAKAAEDDGLLQRFMYSVAGKQLPGLDRMPDVAALQRYEVLFPKLSAMHPQKPAGGHESRAIALHQQAHQHREDIDAVARAMAALPDTSPRLRAAFGKWPGLFARLCLTFHLIDVADARGTETPVPYLDVVPEATARRVASFMYDIVLPHLLRAEAVMFSTAQTTHARWIAGYILAQRMDRITTRDIVRAYRALSPPETRDELAAVMASLVTINWLEPEVPKNRAKPVSAWAVNPAVHTVFAVRAEREREARDKARERIAADIEVLRRKRREAQA